MKKWLGAALCVAIMLSLVPVPGDAHETGLVTASSLVLRAGPGIDFRMLCEIPQQAELALLSYADEWYHVAYGEMTGYVHTRWVGVSLPEAVPWVTPPPEDMRMDSWESTVDGIRSGRFFGDNAEPESGRALPTATIPPLSTYTHQGIAMPAIEFTGDNNPKYPLVMKPGDMGLSVTDLQVTLQNLGFAVEADGRYDYDTQAAVMRVQLGLRIEMDGIVGADTRRRIGGSERGVELLDWWLGGSVAIARLSQMTVVDVQTGTRYKVSRYGGDNHCDAEPLTKADTDAMLALFGPEGWDQQRRPVWLLSSGKRVIAASMDCVPHGGEHILDNGFDGHFCIHLYGSRTHDGDRVDEEHAAAVLEAYSLRNAYKPQ